MAKVTISDMERYGSFGWEWVLLFEEADGYGWACNYRTSRDGDGLWMNGKQIEGTTQFSLPQRKDRVVAKIMKRWSDK